MINTTELSKSERAMTVLAAVAKIVIEACEDAGDVGMPANMLYLALSQHGMTFLQFQQFMRLLENAGKVRQSHHRYYIVKEKKNGQV